MALWVILVVFLIADDNLYPWETSFIKHRIWRGSLAKLFSVWTRLLTAASFLFPPLISWLLHMMHAFAYLVSHFSERLLLLLSVKMFLSLLSTAWPAHSCVSRQLRENNDGTDLRLSGTPQYSPPHNLDYHQPSDTKKPLLEVRHR